MLKLYIQWAAAKPLQWCPTLCDPMDSSPTGSLVPGILQARTLEWVAISFSNAWKWKVKMKLFSRVWLPETPWTAAHQAPPSMGFSRQEYWSGVSMPSPTIDINVYKYILLHEVIFTKYFMLPNWWVSCHEMFFSDKFRTVAYNAILIFFIVLKCLLNFFIKRAIWKKNFWYFGFLWMFWT